MRPDIPVPGKYPVAKHPATTSTIKFRSLAEICLQPDIPVFANLRFGARPARGNGDGEHAGEGEGEREGVQTDEELTPVSWGSSATAGAAGGGRIELGGLGRVRTVSRTIP